MQLFEIAGFHEGPRQAEFPESVRMPDVPEVLHGTQVANETVREPRQVILPCGERTKRVDLRKLPRLRTDSHSTDDIARKPHDPSALHEQLTGR
jgi:hypothetical protein